MISFFFFCFSLEFTYSIIGFPPKHAYQELVSDSNAKFVPFNEKNKNLDLLITEEALELNVERGMNKECTLLDEFPKYYLYQNKNKNDFSVSFDTGAFSAASLVNCILDKSSAITYTMNTEANFIFSEKQKEFENFTEISIENSPFGCILEGPLRVSVFSKSETAEIASKICKTHQKRTHFFAIIGLALFFASITFTRMKKSTKIDKDAQIWIFDRNLNYLKGGDYSLVDDGTKMFIRETQEKCVKYNKPVTNVIKIIRNESYQAFVHVGSFPANGKIVSAKWIETFNEVGKIKCIVTHESTKNKVLKPPQIKFTSYRDYWPFNVSFTTDDGVKCSSFIPAAVLVPFQPYGQLVFSILSSFYNLIPMLRKKEDGSLNLKKFVEKFTVMFRAQRIVVFQNNDAICNSMAKDATDIPIEQLLKLTHDLKPNNHVVHEKLFSTETNVFVQKFCGSENIITVIIEYPSDNLAPVADEYTFPFFSLCVVYIFHLYTSIVLKDNFAKFEDMFGKEEKFIFVEFLLNKRTIFGNSHSKYLHVKNIDELIKLIVAKGYNRLDTLYPRLKDEIENNNKVSINILARDHPRAWFTLNVSKVWSPIYEDYCVSVVAERLGEETAKEVEILQTLNLIDESPDNKFCFRFLINDNGQMVMMDKRIFTFLGIPPDNMLLSSIVIDEDRANIKQAEFLRKVSLRLRSKDGPRPFVLIKLRGIGFLICPDTFQELNLQSSNNIQITGNSSAVTFWVVNVRKDQVQSLFWQPTIWDVIGVPYDTPFSHFVTYIHQDDREQFSHGYEALLNGKKIQYLSEVRIMRTGETYQWYKLSFAMSKSGIIHFLAMNVNKQKEVETKLKETNQLRDLLLSSGKIALWNFTDDDDEIIPSKGFEAGVIMSIKMNWKYISTYIPEDYRKKVTEEIKKSLEFGSSIELDVPILLVNNTTSWVSIRGKGNTLRREAVGVCIDITELRNAFNRLEVERQKAEEASKQKTLFLTNMSHEIRTPMNGIFGMLDVLSLQELTSEQRLLVDSIRSSSFQLMNLLNDTLHLSKIGQGDPEIHNKNFCIWDLIEPTVIANYTKAKENGVKLILDIKMPFPDIVNADAQLFMKILNNILSNAIKFTKQGFITIKMRVEDETLYLSVSDTGIGISKDQQAVIFERFAQANNCVARFFGGSGLGLSLVQEISKFLGGEVTVDSEIGKGSTFHVKIPFETSYYTYAPSLSAHKRVLVRIDDEYTKRAIVDWCRYEGFDVLEISSPDEFMQNSKKPTIALFVESCAPNLKMFKDIANRVSTVSVCAVTDPCEVCIFKYCIPRPVMFHHLTKFFDMVVIGKKAEAPKLNIECDTPMHILVAEDNKTNQKVMRKILEGLHCTLSIADNGKVAIDLLEKEVFDLIFMDCQMPVLDGLDATRIIRASGKHYSAIPIIALTAGAVEGSEEACMEAGMDAYLAKPVRIQQIREIIRRFSQH